MEKKIIYQVISITYAQAPFFKKVGIPMILSKKILLYLLFDAGMFHAATKLPTYINLVNSDFNCGEITKSNVAEWVLTNLKGSLPKNDIKKIQENYIDEKKLLQDLIKGSTNDGGDLPPEILKAVKEHFGFSTKHKKVS